MNQDWRIRDDGVQELRLGSPAPQLLACPPTVACNPLAVTAPSFPSECPSERQERNYRRALLALPRLESVPCETGDRKFLRQYLRS